MIASVHIADVGFRSALATLRKAPAPGSTTGLRHANVAITAPLRSGGLPSLNVGRVGLIAFWDDDDALDRFLADHPLARTFAGGWQLRLDPLRASGTWPGLSREVPAARTVEYDGPAAVLTLGRLRASQTVRFFRTSGNAEASATKAEGLTWATALARPPFVSTCSLWRDTRALSTYAYGHREPAHSNAIDAQNTKPFHHESAFVRFRPYDSRGSLGGKNPLAESWMTATA